MPSPKQRVDIGRSSQHEDWLWADNVGQVPDEKLLPPGQALLGRSLASKQADAELAQLSKEMVARAQLDFFGHPGVSDSGLGKKVFRQVGLDELHLPPIPQDIVETDKDWPPPLLQEACDMFIDEVKEECEDERAQGKTWTREDHDYDGELCEEDFADNPACGGYALKPFTNEVPSFIGKVMSLLDAPALQPRERKASIDGTVLQTPRSPPVLGRKLFWRSDEVETTIAEISVPTLRRQVHEKAKSAVSGAHAAAPWSGEVQPRPGRKAEAAEHSKAGVEAPSVFSFLRSHFADVDLANTRQVGEKQLVAFVEARTKQRLGEVPADYQKLLTESARRCFHQASVRKDGIRVEDWVHFGLLLASSPSALAHQLLNRRLRRELAVNPLFLRKVLDAFEEADARGAGHLRAKDVEAAFIGCNDLLIEMKLAAVNPGSSQVLSYYDFVAFCLGYRRSPVTLNWYDVSRGYAQWMPTGILGVQKQEGIWHTGVVAFGREYWFGGKVLASEPGKAPFPPGPVRSTELGMTLRTREEFEDWLRFEVVSRYTREKYDILRRNCNHFSDEVAGFLIQGCHIPDEARKQPEALIGTPVLDGIRPYLNRWLGGFEAEQAYGAEIDDLTGEWRARLWPGDICLYLPRLDGGQQQAKLAQVSNVDAWRGTCDITYFDTDGIGWEAHRDESLGALASDVRVMRLGSCVHSGSFWDWRLVHERSVSLLSLRPHESDGGALPLSSRQGAIAGPMGLGALLRAGLKTIDPGIQSVLKRKAVVYAHCPQGHAMQPAETQRSVAWRLRPTSSITCSMCEAVLKEGEPKLECVPCGFYLCGPCDRKGLFRGYYSLGSVDSETARQLMEEPPWIYYKARRYMAAAGAAGGLLSLEVWQGRLAVRLYGDLGQNPPGKGELVDLFRRHSAHGDGSFSLGLNERQFCSLLSELLALHANVFHL